MVVAIDGLGGLVPSFVWIFRPQPISGKSELLERPMTESWTSNPSEALASEGLTFHRRGTKGSLSIVITLAYSLAPVRAVDLRLVFTEWMRSRKLGYTLSRLYISQTIQVNPFQFRAHIPNLSQVRKWQVNPEPGYLIPIWIDHSPWSTHSTLLAPDTVISLACPSAPRTRYKNEYPNPKSGSGSKSNQKLCLQPIGPDWPWRAGPIDGAFGASWVSHG